MSRIASEDVTAYERWELPTVDDGEQHTYSRPMSASQLEALQKRAYEEAYALGHAEGLTAGRAEGSALGQAEIHRDGLPALQTLQAALEQLAAPLASLDEEVIEVLTTLAFNVGQELAIQRLEAEPALIVDLLHRTVERLPYAKRTIRVLAHPDDLALLDSVFASELSEQTWVMVPDPAMVRGGCVLEAGASRVDARMQTRIAALCRDVLGGDAALADPNNVLKELADRSLPETSDDRGVPSGEC